MTVVKMTSQLMAFCDFYVNALFSARLYAWPMAWHEQMSLHAEECNKRCGWMVISGCLGRCEHGNQWPTSNVPVEQNIFIISNYSIIISLQKIRTKRFHLVHCLLLTCSTIATCSILREINPWRLCPST